MTRVRLGEVARESRLKASDVETLPTVGLEHLDPGDVELHRWDEGGETAFTKRFLPGQVLFGRRRAYLQKAVVAPFEGVCSGDITVIEAIPGKVSERLLPFVIQNPALFDFAVEKSAGSLSPRVKWGRLSEFEFDLPPERDQERIADILWASQRVKSCYKSLVQASDDLVKSQFVEMFGDPTRGTALYPMLPMGDFASITSGATPKRDIAEYYGGDIPWVKTTEVASGDVAKTEETLTELGLNNSSCHIIPAGTVLVAMYGQGGTRGKASMLKIDAATNQACAAIIPNPSVNAVFLLSQLRLCYEDLRSRSKGGNQKNLSLQTLKSYRAIVPPINKQNEFAAFVQRIDKSKFALQRSLNDLDAMTKKLMSEELGLGNV